MEQAEKNIGKYIIAGAGADGRYLLKVLGSENVVCFSDNNPAIKGTFIDGVQVTDYKYVYENYPDIKVIISSFQYQDKIAESLKENGIENFITSTEFLLENILCKEKKPDGKRIFLLNSHDGRNMGDILISIAELYFFRKYLNDYEVVEVPLSACLGDIDILKKNVSKEDIITISGGGYMGSLWMDGGENNIRKYIQGFPHNRIYIFPQTMYFGVDKVSISEKKKTQDIYNRHQHLTICFRDRASYDEGKRIFSENVHKYYIPDVVTLMDESFATFERRGITICFRDDKEVVINDENRKKLIILLSDKDPMVDSFSMICNERVAFSERMDKLNLLYEKIQRSRLVVTDRLHCMLTCAVTGTPCAALNNISGKIKGTYEWIWNNKHIRYFDSAEELIESIEELIAIKPSAYERSQKIEQLFKELAEDIRTGEFYG